MLLLLLSAFAATFIRLYVLRVQNKLDDLADGSKLALRDLSLTFPVGLADICRQAFQVLYDRLLQRDKSTSKKPRENAAYSSVTSLLVTARQPLPLTAFGASSDEVFCCLHVGCYAVSFQIKTAEC